jgi:restriction endonuclease S subunit
MGSEDLHLREWGELTDEYLGPAFIRKFEEGDILYGSRRTYLRKVVIAPFSGITSNTTFVIKANEKLIDKRLLPFVMMSEGFTENSIRNSKGSVNPYINWKDIANYEFLLPPKDQQAQLAELLWAIDEVIEREREVLQMNTKLKTSVSNNLLLGKNISVEKFQKSPYGPIPLSWSLVNLYDLRDINDRYSFTGGPFGSDLKSEHYTDHGVRVLQLQNIGEGEFLNDYSIYTSVEKADQLFSCSIFPGEIILAKMAPVARCCIIPNYDTRYIMCSDGIRLKVNEKLYDKQFIYHALNSEHFLRYAETKSTGSTRGRIGLGELKAIPLPIPENINRQKEIAHELDLIDQIHYKGRSKISSSQSLQKSLINQIF